MEAKSLAPLCRLTGQVVHGRGKGRTVDMPTANLLPDPGQPLPPEGVYASLVEVDGAFHPGVTNVGPRPTVDQDAAPTVETYLIHFREDLYGRRITVSLYRSETYTEDISQMTHVALMFTPDLNMGE